MQQCRPAVVLTAVLSILVCGAYPLIVLGIAQLAFPDQANGSLLNSHGRIVGSALIGQSFTRPEYFHPRPSAAGSGYDPTNSGGSNLGPTSAAFILGSTKPAPDSGTALPAASAAPVPPPAPALVVDNDGIAVRIAHYCQENHLPLVLMRGGAVIDPGTFLHGGTWDDVGLITACTDPDHPVRVRSDVPIPVDALTASGSGLDPHISEANARLQAHRVALARHMTDAEVASLIAACREGWGAPLLGEWGINVLRLNLALDAWHR